MPGIPAARGDQRSATPSTIPPRWRRGVQVGWLALVLLCLALYAAMTPVFFTLTQRVCDGGACQLTGAQARALVHLGFSARDYALGGVAVNSLFMLVACAVAAVLFWRRSHDWMALLVGLSLVALGNNSLASDIGSVAGPWQTPATIIDTLDLALFVLVFALFPDGRFTPRWSRWLPVAVLALLGPINLVPTLPLPLWSVAFIYLGIYGGVISAQVYRYRRVSGPTQRAQTRWALFGLVTTLLVNIALYQTYSLIPTLQTPDSLYNIASEMLFRLVALLVPLSVGVAILRYRLYDIDIIINRAVVYGSLTAILAGVYIALVIGTQRVVSLITHQDSSALAIVISTLAISALFQPLRRRLQTFIDQRFFRSKYDAARTIAAFSATLRSETDLARMRERLLDVVDETMRPASASLWLRDPQQRASSDI
ncbi:MAG: hypothetical protein KGO05_06300 [Chloroflexota bacterium]|nr:hypothetical protein [Chloroflexota bacterium]